MLPLIVLPPPLPVVRVALPTTLIVNSDVSVVLVGDAVRLDVYGEVHAAGRVASMLTAQQAKRLATELARLAQQIAGRL